MTRRMRGGFFGEIDWKSVGVILAVLIVVTGVVVGVILFALPKKDSSTPQQTGGGAVAPPMSGLPGRITIAEIAPAPSAGQAIIYFSKAEASGTTCEECTSTFDVNMKYIGGSPQQPSYKQLTFPGLSGTVTVEYGTSSSGFGPLTPGSNNTVPPKSVEITVRGRVVNPRTGAMGSPTTFTKKLPYV